MTEEYGNFYKGVFIVICLWMMNLLVMVLILVLIRGFMGGVLPLGLLVLMVSAMLVFLEERML